jgi:hypothetical protein
MISDRGNVFLSQGRSFKIRIGTMDGDSNRTGGKKKKGKATLKKALPALLFLHA